VVELRPGQRNERIVIEWGCFKALVLRGRPAEDRGFFFVFPWSWGMSTWRLVGAHKGKRDDGWWPVLGQGSVPRLDMRSLYSYLFSETSWPVTSRGHWSIQPGT
jgi:hypothetical protein